MNDGEHQHAADPDLARAEALMDRLTEHVADLTARLGRQARVTVARAREEIEDIWAEAQHRSMDDGRQ